MVFPGQGSQSVGMLRSYAGLLGIEETLLEAAGVLGPDFSRILGDGPPEQLNLTVNTQPAMVTAGIAVYRAWIALGGPKPQVVAGHSLGEYSALVAAESVGFRDALPLVRFRAQAMQEAVPEGHGAMAAVIGISEDEIRKACNDAGGVVEAVNFNAPGQIVIAGEKAAVSRAIEACKARGAKRALPLPVSAPFHSSLMKPAGERLRAYLHKVTLATPLIPVVNNVDVSIESRPDDIRHALVRQSYSPVRWVEVIQRMVRDGATHIIECGPGRALAGMTKRIDPQVQSFSLADRASLEQAMQAIKGAGA